MTDATPTPIPARPPGAADRETLPVELVDAAGNTIGSCPVAEAHRAPGALHRAFSVLIFDSAGRTLLQQRAPAKTRFPARWSNTCCGHPAPGLPVDEAAGIRLGEEMGLVVPLTEVGVYSYRAEDPRTGYVEHEWDHVLVGSIGEFEPAPDPAEVAAFRWVRPDDVRLRLRDEPDMFSPWFAGVLEVATAHLPNR
ncbi:isopentenyl-diphosphate Delta-isomerase [Nocardia sp. NPDC019395]|uniref:isopentenyl-diphosphate Delta-isomerase n=1 Tax=Nocardia sp. NPDC019395 TaxID=3154686 RepID=UPI0034099F0F